VLEAPEAVPSGLQGVDVMDAVDKVDYRFILVCLNYPPGQALRKPKTQQNKPELLPIILCYTNYNTIKKLTDLKNYYT